MVGAAPAPQSASAGEQPDILVAVVTYNSAEIVENLLRALPLALAGGGTAEVVVVDNDSHDGTVELVRRVAPWAVVIEARTNLGYGPAINRALRRTQARRAVYVLNPDAIPSPGSVRLLLDALESSPEIGLAVPRVVDVQGRLKFSLRREPTLGRALGEALLGGHRAARYPWLGDMIRDPSYYVHGATADWATGAALFLSAEAVATVGLWDESYFLYSEETDYALRLRDAGYRLIFVPGAEVVHPGGDMSRSPWLWSLVAVNRTRLYTKRNGRLRGASYWLVVLLNEGARSLLGRRTHREAFRALLLGVRPPAQEPTVAATSRRASARPS